MTDESHSLPPSDDELLEAQALLQRTVDFLTRCVEDPDQALAQEDPQALIRGLEDLARDRFADSPPPSIRRRRSA